MAATFPFPLPTTGALSLASFLLDPTSSYTSHLADADAARARLRAVLKDERRSADGERDALAVVHALDEYMPYLNGVVASLATDDLLLSQEPVFSWRATLTHSILPNPSRHNLPTLLAEQAFVLLTHLEALANLSSALLLALSPTASGAQASITAAARAYEHDATLSTEQRKAKDAKLGQAADLLCRASGVGEYLAEHVLGEWERERRQRGGGGRGKGKAPAEGSKAFVQGLSKMLLADAQLLSIRKLLSPTLSSTPHLGPPLARGHPSPSLLVKLHVNVASLYASAIPLVLSSSSSSSSDNDTETPIPALGRYLREGRAFAEAMSRKWLGIEAGESAGASGARIGEAIVWLRASKKAIEDLEAEGGGRGGGGGSAESSGTSGGGRTLLGRKKLGPSGKEEKKDRKGRLAEELETIKAFLSAYEKVNNQIYFQPLPSLSSLLTRVPEGRAVLSMKPFVPPAPAFGPGSVGYVSRSGEGRGYDGDEDDGGLAGGFRGMHVGGGGQPSQSSGGGGGGYF